MPVEMRRALALQPGDDVVLVLEEGSLRMIPAREAVRHAQAEVAKYVGKGRSLSRELLAERRREIRRG